MTREEILKACPHASEATIRNTLAYHSQPTGAHPERIRPQQPERPAIVPLDSSPLRKETGTGRAQIVFTVYAVRPLDWDNYFIKPLQDWLAVAGLIRGDKWNQLEGRVRSEKVSKTEEERTEIEII